MAGYMGFGMQSWLYKKKPRKPFDKRETLPSYRALPKYQRTFQPKRNKNRSTKLTAFLTIAIIFCFLIVLNYMSAQFVTYSKKHRKALNQKNIDLDNEAFNFLMDSGIFELKSQRPEIAFKKFELALKLFPEDERINQLYLETLSVLCEKDKVKYCDLFNDKLSILKTN